MDVGNEIFVGHEEETVSSPTSAGSSDVIKTSDGKFVCRLCGQLFKHKTNCINHLSTFHGVEVSEKNDNIEREDIVRLYCPHCRAAFRWQKNLYKHIRTYHKVEPEVAEKQKEGPFICAYCDVPFTSISNLNRHCRTKHCNEKTAQTSRNTTKYCPMCKQKFCGEASLQCHTRVFHKIVLVSSGSSHNRKMRRKFYQFSCKLCNLKLNKRFNMNRHVISQHGVEPNGDTVSLLVTYIHQDTKQLIESFHCQDCTEDFDNETSWESHMKDTHGLRPETCCGICGAHSFQFMKDLKTHMQEMHSIPPVVLDEDRQFVRLHKSTLGLSDSEMHALAKVPEWLVKRGDGQLVIGVFRN